MKLQSVLSVTEAKNKDIIIRLAISPSLAGAMPGQYVNIAMSVSEGGVADKITSAFFFAVNTIAEYVEIYLPHDDAKMQGIGTTLTSAALTEITMSEPQGDAFILPNACLFGSNSTYPSSKVLVKPVLLADEAGLPAIIFLAEKIKTLCGLQPVVFLFSTKIFPFTPIPSQFVISNIPMGVLAACPMLEDKKIPSRLINDVFMPGCYDGNINEFLAELSEDFFTGVNITLYAAGKKEVLDVIKVFSEKHQLPLLAINAGN